MEPNETIRAELLRYMEEYGWEPRITTKLINLRHGTNYTAEEIKSLYGSLRNPTIDPASHLQNLEARRFPIEYCETEIT